MEEIEKTKACAFYVADNEQINLRKEIIYKERYTPYSMIGQCRRKNTRKDYMDIFNRLTSIPKATAQLWDEIKEHTDKETGIAIMTIFDTYPKAVMGTVYRRLVKLKELDLIRKVISFKVSDESLTMVEVNASLIKNHTYMINPYLLKPWKYSLAVSIWEQLEAPKNPYDGPK